jgi:hypothetical protein
LFPENRPVMEVLELTRHQYIMAFGGPVSLRLEAVIEAARLLKVPNGKQVVTQVMALGDHIIKKQSEKESDS